MEFIIKAGQLLLSLSLLVLLHEFGHFIFARLFKTRVEKFYLFFNPWFSLFKIKKGETEFGIGWLPLGGYCKISGMIDESMDKEQMKQAPKPYEFRSKPAWQRLFIMLGGVFFNFLTAFFIYSMVLFTWGDKYTPTANVKYGIICDTLAMDMGLRNGDMVLGVNNNEVEDFAKIFPEIIYQNGKTIQIKRNGEKMDIAVPEGFIGQYIERRRYLKENFPKYINFIEKGIPFYIRKFKEGSVGEKAGLKIGDRVVGLNNESLLFFQEFAMMLPKIDSKDIIVSVDRNGELLDYSITLDENMELGAFWVEKDPETEFDELFARKTIKYGFFASFPAGIKRGTETISSYLKDLKLIFSPKTKAYKSLGGFIAIGNIFPAQWDWRAFWLMTALISKIGRAHV